MRQVSDALAAAIEAPERTTRLRVSVDWRGDGHDGPGTLDDLTGRFAGASMDRTLQADTPEQVRVVEGSTAATLDVDLVSGDTTDEQVNAARYYSVFNRESPLYGVTRQGLDVQADAEFLTADGWQSMPRFRGQVRSVPVSARDLRAELAALDYRDRLRTRIVLPAIVAEDTGYSDYSLIQAPGLESTWVVSWALAQCGVYVSPPPRPGCRIWIPCHGSTFPAVADMVGGVGFAFTLGSDGETVRRTEFVPGRYLLETEQAPTGGVVTTSAHTRDVDDEVYRITTADGHTSGRLEMFAHVGNTAGPSIPTIGATYYDTSPLYVYLQGAAYGYTNVKVRVTTAGVLQLVLGSTTVTGPTMTVGDGERHFIGVWWDSSTGTARFNLDGTVTTATYAYTPVTGVPGATDEGDLFVTVGPGGSLSEVHLTGGTAADDPWLPDLAWTAGAVIDRSQNQLQGIADPDAHDVWELLDDLAAAELGAVWLDEDGMLQWATSARLVQEQSQVVQRTLTSATELVDLAYDDPADQLRNRVIAAYSPIVVHVDEQVYSASNRIGLGTYEARTLRVELSGAAVTTPQLALTANTQADGSGTDVTSYVDYEILSRPTASSVVIRLTNHYWDPAWLVGTDGQPALTFVATWIEQASGAVPPDVATAEVLAGTEPERPLELSANSWRQTWEMAAGIAQALLCSLRVPRQILTAVEVPADPRLQPYDRVRITDQSATMLDADYWVTGISESWDDSGDYTQQLTARPAASRYLAGVGLAGVDIVG